MAPFVPFVTFAFDSDTRVTLPESLLASPLAGGITFGSFTDSAFVTLGGPTPAEATVAPAPQCWQPATVPPVLPAIRHPVPTATVARVAPAPQCRQPVVVVNPAVPTEVPRVRVPPPTSTRKRGAQTEAPSPSSSRTPALPIVPIPLATQVVGSDVPSSSTSGLGRRA
ncbi:classical arabinogalactan protein 9-like [Dendrobium catenatum]|uniref:classical arabinogalactan protein 9-like n=1 Tax=Dendrobium catenatum TaxID=906689 RepID=UPI0009F5E10A|nr:classical arabinogalactan protein 9-like [Dendrobium catenatum]